jgi:hypothetical protein
VVDDPRVSGLLADRGLKPKSHSATLRGIANEVSVYAIP